MAISSASPDGRLTLFAATGNIFLSCLLFQYGSFYTCFMSSKVYFLPWDERARLKDLLMSAGLPEMLDAGDYAAVKTHFGEKGNTGYVKPEFFHPIIQIAKSRRARAFLTDSNTIYHGERNNAVKHLAAASEHGFSLEKLGIPVIIADGIRGDSFKEIPVKGKHFKKVKIASDIAEADAIIAVSHFKGHLMAGFGGAIKNLGMGCGARIGKFEMHSSTAPTIKTDKCTGCGMCVKVCAQKALEVVDGKISIDLTKCAGCGECILECAAEALSITWNESGKSVQERFAEYAMGAVQNKKLFCVTFVNNITPNCDCISKKETSLVPDIGILASKDPVAIDQAALDLVLRESGKDVFRQAHPSIDHDIQLVHAEKIGLGTRSYNLITNNQAPINNNQTPLFRSLVIWSLEFIWNLEFGYWLFS
jgi:uncharacterized Fe-S center protein